MTFSSRPNAEMANNRATSPPPFALRLFALMAAYGLLSQHQWSVGSAAAAEVRHVRHKRTVSDFMENIMNAVYFHMQDDDEDDGGGGGGGPLPLPSTVIARFTHVPTTAKVYKYVPVQTLKVSKVRARKIVEPKIKIKYPKKFSIKTQDSSITVVKNDLPWTLHPLPPPLSTAKTIKLEVDKAMPWALHPLPPPVKTKNYSDYYWPDSRTRPKYAYVSKPPTKPHRFANAYKYHNKPAPGDIKLHSDFKPSDFKHSDIRPDDHKPASDEYKHEDGFHDGPKNYKQTDDFKHVNYKHIDYKHVGYKSPDYKPEHVDSDEVLDGQLDGQLDDSGQRPVFNHQSVFSHDDHSAGGYSSSSSSSRPTSTEYVSHISIEPSVQIASFSNTDMRGDGSSRQPVSQGDNKAVCRCPATGHRHKRHAAEAVDGTNGTATVGVSDPVAEQSKTLHSYAARPRSVGHATDVEIQKSHDITDNVMPIIAVSQSSPPPKIDTTFRDDSDMFKVDFGRAINAWDESKSRTAAEKGRSPLSSSRPLKSDDDDDDYASSDFGHRQVRKPGPQRTEYHVTKSAMDNKGGKVSFSVQTPFSVSSFSSNYRRPYAEDGERDDGYRSPFRSDQSGTTSSSFRSSSGEYLEPLDFEHFGFKSAVRTDDELSGRLRTDDELSGRLRTDDELSGRLRSDDKLSGRLRVSDDHFSRDFADKPSGVLGDKRFSDGFGGDKTSNDYSSGGGRLTSSFSRDFGGEIKPSRYTSKNRGLLSDRFAAGRPSLIKTGGAGSGDTSVLEYFQPVVVDFDRSKDDDGSRSKLSQFGGNNNDRSRYFGKADSGVFSKFKKNQNPDPLRLPGELHESIENLSRKMVFHPSTFDNDK